MVTFPDICSFVESVEVTWYSDCFRNIARALDYEGYGRMGTFYRPDSNRKAPRNAWKVSLNDMTPAENLLYFKSAAELACVPSRYIYLIHTVPATTHVHCFIICPVQLAFEASTIPPSDLISSNYSTNAISSPPARSWRGGFFLAEQAEQSQPPERQTPEPHPHTPKQSFDASQVPSVRQEPDLQTPLQQLPPLHCASLLHFAGKRCKRSEPPPGAWASTARADAEPSRARRRTPLNIMVVKYADVE